MASNVISVCKTILELAEQKFDNPTELSSWSKAEILNYAQKLFTLIEETVLTNNLPTFYTSLEFEDDFEAEHHEEYEKNEDEDCSPCSEHSTQDWEIEEIDNVSYSFDKMQMVVDFYDKCKKNKLFQTQKRFPFVTNSKFISRFRKYLARNGTNAFKLKQIEQYTAEKFQEARGSLICISERDLVYWAVSKAKQISFGEFQASSFWLYNFKRKRRIVSRKITKYTTTKDIAERASIEAKGKEFVEKVKMDCCNIPSACIWNYDQSGFNYEMKHNRTLSFKGESDTMAAQKSLNASTHSYTVMPLVSMDGRLYDKLLVCLQEPSGSLGPRVKASMTIPDNIYLTCSKSGMLDKEIMRKWIQDCVTDLASGSDSCVLIHDSWTGQTDPNLYKDIPNLAHRFQIPGKTTCVAQPLDVYFFRQYKIIRRKISDRVFLDGLDVDLHKRDNVLKMHSLIFNQLQSSNFKPMLQYSWYACKYTDNRAGHFLNANELLFGFKCEECGIYSCEKVAFIKCSHCGEHLCISHFLVDFHFHKPNLD